MIDFSPVLSLIDLEVSHFQSDLNVSNYESIMPLSKKFIIDVLQKGRKELYKNVFVFEVCLNIFTVYLYFEMKKCICRLICICIRVTKIMKSF